MSDLSAPAMLHLVPSFITHLMNAATFEDTAAITMPPMLERCAAALGSSRFAGKGRILRGMIHLRPADGYRHLIMMEHGAPHQATPSTDAEEQFVPSATAWRWVAERGCAAAVDVQADRVQLHQGDGMAVVQEYGEGNDFAATQRTQRMLDKRDATHLYLVPLRTPAGTIEGMISIEATCRAAFAQDFIWGECGADVQLLAGIAAPYLTGRPLRPTSEVPRDELLPVVGKAMARRIKLLQAFSARDETILLSGPTGAGKSRLARWCHAQSTRKRAAFEWLDLMTVPENLQLGTLFGWKRGAFSGAVSDNPGSVVRAEGGTLFLDEIDKLTPSAQAGLLKLVDERLFHPLGDRGPEKQADLRFIVGTNADLGAEVRAGRFREDLYYRINVLPVALLPLDQRTDEIPLWARHMVAGLRRAGGPEGNARLTESAEQALSKARWPGNLRQLENILRRAYVIALAEREVTPDQVTIDARHVQEALDHEVPTVGEGRLVRLLRDAASAFVDEAERRAESGGVLKSEHARALEGLILGTTAQRVGKERAYEILGKAALLKGRNHHRDLRNELEKVQSLFQALGHEAAMPFAHMLDSDEK